jgi:outer membrane protein TolC
MTKRIVTLALLSSSALFALTIDEAVQKAVQNSHLIEQKQEALNVSTYNKEKNYSNFLPKVNLSYSYNDRDNKRVSSNNVDSQYTATVSYNLFNGFSDVYSQKASNQNELVSKYQLKATKEDVALDTKVAYIDYLRAKENLNVQKESVNLLKKQFEDTKIHFAQGMVAKNDLLKVEVELLSIEQKLNRAISDLKIAKINLTRLVGDFLTEPKNIKAEDKSLEYKVLSTNMYNNRSELKALVSQKVSYQNQKRASYSGFMPKVDISSSYTKFGDETMPNGRGTLDDENTTSVTASWNLFNGNSDNLNRKIYMSQVLSADAQINDMKKSLNLQLAKAYEEYKLSKSNLKIAQKAKEQAKENYSIVDNQFKQGIAKTSDTLDAREYLTRAKSEYNLAYYNMLESQYKIERITESR